jgi:hypothetical protein
MAIFDSLSEVDQEILNVGVSTGNKALTRQQIDQCDYYVISGATSAGRTITFVVPTRSKEFAIASDDTNTQDVTLIKGNTQITISPAAAMTIAIDTTPDGFQQL